MCPDPVKPGEFLDLKIRVQSITTNTRQNDLNNLKVELIQDYPFTLPSDNSLRDLGSLRAGESIDTSYRIRVASDAPDGTSKMRFKYSTDEEVSVTSDGPLSINIRSLESTLVINSIKTDPEFIKAGSKAELNLGLKNAATSSMRDISVKLDLGGTPFSPLETTAEKRIRRLSPDQETTIGFSLIADVNAESKPYRIPITITYLDDQNNKFAKNDTIGLLMYSEPELDFNIEEQKVFESGKTGDVIVSVSNIGPSKVKFINLKLEGSNDYDIVSSDKVYLGNLDADDFQTANFKIHVKKENPKLLLRVDYKDSYNSDLKKNVILDLKTYSSSQAASYGLVSPRIGIFSIILYIILVVFLYHVYKGWRHYKSIGKGIIHGAKRTLVHMIRFILWFRWRKLKTVPERLRKMLRE